MIINPNYSSMIFFFLTFLYTHRQPAHMTSAFGLHAAWPPSFDLAQEFVSLL